MTTTRELTPDTSIYNLTRNEVSALTDKYTKTLLRLAPRDPAFSVRFPGLLPEHSLCAFQRDAGGLSATECDISTVIQAIATTPWMYNLIYGKDPSFYSGGREASAWAAEVRATLRARKMRQACSMVAGALSTMASNTDERADAETLASFQELSATLREFAERFSAGPDASTGCVLSSEEAAWWGANKELVWNDDETQLVEVRRSPYPSIFDLVLA